MDVDAYLVGASANPFLGLGSIQIDLMNPIDPEKSPKVHKPALNHIGLWIDDLSNCVEYLESVNIKCIGGIRQGAHGYDITFVHPKSAQGTLLELVQAPEDIISEYKSHNK